MTTTKELEALLATTITIGNSAITERDKLAADLIKERANSARLIEALKMCLAYIETEDMRPLNLNTVRAAIKQAEETK